MKPLYKEETRKVFAGNKFSLKDDVETLTIDETGAPIEFVHDTSCYRGGGCFSRTKKDSDFKSQVMHFMESLLEENKSEFKLLRESLNSEYYQLAEQVRKKAANAYNF